MDDSKTVTYSLRAIADITGWPNKAVRPILIVRCKERQTTVYAVFGMAMAVESGDTRQVDVRFDSDEMDPSRNRWQRGRVSMFETWALRRTG
jgi:hypothetical protein